MKTLIQKLHGALDLLYLSHDRKKCVLTDFVLVRHKPAYSVMKVS